MAFPLELITQLKTHIFRVSLNEWVKRVVKILVN